MAYRQVFVLTCCRCEAILGELPAGAVPPAERTKEPKFEFRFGKSVYTFFEVCDKCEAAMKNMEVKLVLQKNLLPPKEKLEPKQLEFTVPQKDPAPTVEPTVSAEDKSTDDDGESTDDDGEWKPEDEPSHDGDPGQASATLDEPPKDWAAVQPEPLHSRQLTGLTKLKREQEVSDDELFDDSSEWTPE